MCSDKMVSEIKNILHATDLSENARYAFLERQSPFFMFWRNFLRAVWDWSVKLSGKSVGRISKNVRRKRFIASIRTRIEDLCNEIRQKIPECPFIVQKIIVKTGRPVDQIIHFAEKKDCDMVVMGSHGHGIFQKPCREVHHAGC